MVYLLQDGPRPPPGLRGRRPKVANSFLFLQSSEEGKGEELSVKTD